jgi:hypothetical protein
MLQLHQICHTFKHKTVAQDINLTVHSGCITALLGASGSGKSTLLNIITGLISPDCGEVLLNNQLLNPIVTEKRHIAMMFQDFALLPHLNVWQNVAFGLRLSGMQKKEAQHIAQFWLNEVGLHEATFRPIDDLSGGEKQRVALARALAGSPQLLLLDEPFSSLDTAWRGQLQNLTRDLVKQHNIPALLVTHDPKEACLMAEHLAILISGSIVQHGTPDEILAHPISSQTAKLLGCLNVFPQFYIPQNALFLDDNRGELCNVISCFRQPENWHITLAHPVWGEIICLTNQAYKKNCRLWINDSLVIHFSD